MGGERLRHNFARSRARLADNQDFAVELFRVNQLICCREGMVRRNDKLHNVGAPWLGDDIALLDGSFHQPDINVLSGAGHHTETELPLHCIASGSLEYAFVGVHRVRSLHRKSATRIGEYRRSFRAIK